MDAHTYIYVDAHDMCKGKKRKEKCTSYAHITVPGSSEGLTGACGPGLRSPCFRPPKLGQSACQAVRDLGNQKAWVRSPGCLDRPRPRALEPWWPTGFFLLQSILGPTGPSLHPCTLQPLTLMTPRLDKLSM